MPSPTTAAGHVDVIYTGGAPGWSLTVSDNGVGRDEGQGDNEGRTWAPIIVESLAKQLGAIVVISDETPGTHVKLESHSAQTG
jgi:two-component sensor histidine kinase